MNSRRFSFGVSRPIDYCGRGYLGGFPPVEDGPDGRLRKLNQPFRGRVLVLERSTLICCASVLSNGGGEWIVRGLSPNYRYMVIGTDAAGTVNSAIQDWVQPYVEA